MGCGGMGYVAVVKIRATQVPFSVLVVIMLFFLQDAGRRSGAVRCQVVARIKWSRSEPTRVRPSVLHREGEGLVGYFGNRRSW